MSASLTEKQKQHRKFIESPEWEAIRQRIFKKRGKKCEICLSDKNIQVHHLTYERFGGDEFDEDLIILCAKHHMKSHGILKESDTEKNLREQIENNIDLPWCFRAEYEGHKTRKRNKPKVKRKKKKKRKKKTQIVLNKRFEEKVILRKA